MYNLWWQQLPRVLLQMSGCWKGKQDPRTHSSMSWHVGTARDRSQKRPEHNKKKIVKEGLPLRYIILLGDVIKFECMIIKYHLPVQHSVLSVHPLSWLSFIAVQTSLQPVWNRKYKNN